MRVQLDEARTLDGLTYEPGLWDLPEPVAAKMLHNFPLVCRLAEEAAEEAAAEPVGLPDTSAKGRGRRAAQRPPADA